MILNYTKNILFIMCNYASDWYIDWNLFSYIEYV